MATCSLANEVPVQGGNILETVGVGARIVDYNGAEATSTCTLQTVSIDNQKLFLAYAVNLVRTVTALRLPKHCHSCTAEMH